jgi:dTDP-L-rhamnose 4-epimerase
LSTEKILITGGLGFIGMEVAKSLVREKRRVILLDNLSSQIHGVVPNLASMPLFCDANVELVRGDVCQIRDWGTLLADVNCVIHLAAETGTAQSMYEIFRYTDTNVSGTASLLDYLANHKHNVTKVVLASSRSVYGEGAYLCSRCGLVFPPARSEAMFRARHWEPRCPTCEGTICATATPESAKTAPASIYAATKLAQEDLVRIASQAFGIPAVIFRLQNVYGEGQSLKNPYTGILSIFSNQLRHGKTINLYEDGQESRDFIHVSDVARAVSLAVYQDAADGCTLNVGSGSPTSVAQMAFLLRKRLDGKTEPIISGQYRLGDIRHGYADIREIETRLGFVPDISLEEGLDRLVAWLQTQPLEPDRVDKATQELVSRGMMQEYDAHTTSI